MTDLAHTGSVARAGLPSVIEPIRRSGSRIAALARQRGLAESAAILLPILLVGATHARGPGLWVAATVYLAACVAIAARMPSPLAHLRWAAATTIVGSSGEELTATVSAGCAAVSPELDSPDDLLSAADVALYMAKRAGRDRVCAA